MAVTQEVVLNFLLEQGGKVKNSELIRKFKPVVESPDPQEKANNRELFKRFVNNIAVVKDEGGTKMVVLKKKYTYLLTEKVPSGAAVEEEQGEIASSSKEEQTELVPLGGSDNIEEIAPSSQETRTSLQDESDPDPRLPEPQDAGSAETTPETTEQAQVGHLNEEPTEDQNEDKRESVFDIVSRMDNAGPVPFPKAWSDAQSKDQVQKPHMLPLRYVQSSFEETNQSEYHPLQPTFQPNAIQESSFTKSPKVTRRQLDDTGSKSPNIKRSAKMIKVSEETKYSDVVPLESSEHEWLVNSTNGRWNHKLLGLIMTDSELAGKRDFISGFTALHWAAKSGNTEMVKLLFDLSEKNGSNINVNARSFGGYTPLHIAAIHECKGVILMLTRDYKANVNIRDNSGKKPYHYLKKNSAVQLKFILQDPATLNVEHAIPMKRNSKVAASILGTTSAFLGVLSDDIAFHDLAKGLKKPGTLNKFFTAPSGVKKKLKARDSYPSISSLCEEPEEPEEIVGKRRPVSEFFSH
ncbi:ankyrin repeat domain-containing protein SOWAHA [Bufo gargarizans]|uniref:ankyrin repeat domain-containing protein SOWAHA n=1 Tax=Bufo gargarizans TaxID=30331 RepID=UPI001CF4090E|nr:ankyrin repeat domain-containing protein SOWAHA [Bufo gargarizans]